MEMPVRGWLVRGRSGGDASFLYDVYPLRIYLAGVVRDRSGGHAEMAGQHTPLHGLAIGRPGAEDSGRGGAAQTVAASSALDQ